ncbi:50S ribosomal protein L25 [candidate division WWE3 bacterium]|uniref:Large ribosomal subunit protein bL25 n=1 Tax=candidate division WWE3 bacterium TaxID=2053526 RepID=A0A7X9E768_UNCKA|nr:50S ribosomal protein L25 [candidate division WWE3 bacterium]
MQLKAEQRERLGKANKYIRRENKIPAVIFGRGMGSVSITLNYNDFNKVYQESGETDLIDIACGNNKYKVLIKDVQFDPVSDKISHVGFYKPDLTEKIEAQVPVEVIGEDVNELIKSGAAIALQLLQEITVEALPEDLPHEFRIDVSSINELGKGITIADLDYDRSKVSIPDLDPTEVVVRIDEVTVEEEPVEEVSEEEAIAGLEATEEKKEEETAENKEDQNKSE